MNDEFGKILEELKKETSYDSIIKEEKEPKFSAGDEQNTKFIENKSINNVDNSLIVEEEKKVISKFNIIWSENKETMLFFMIISVIVIVIGIISSSDYVIFVGVVSFILSAIIIFITFYRYILTVSIKTSIPSGLLDRIERMEGKISYLMKEREKGVREYVGHDLRTELEEIKAVLKTLMTVNRKK